MRSTGPMLVALGLTVAAAGARLRGIDYLPTRSTIDEITVLREVTARRDGATVPRSGMHYPILLAGLTVLLPDPRLAAVEAREGRRERSAAEHMRLAGAQKLQVRRVSVWGSSLLVLLTFLLARRWLSPAGALCAAAFVATSLVHARFGSMARPHGLASTMVALSVLASLHLRRRGSLLAFALAGACAGLAIGALHYGLAALPALGVAGWLRAGRVRRPLGFALALGLVALAVRVFYPFHFGAEALRIEPDGGALALSGHRLHAPGVARAGLVPLTLWNYDPVLLIGTALATSAFAWRVVRRGLPRGERGRDLAVAAAHALPFALVITFYPRNKDRWVLQLLPYFAILVAWGLARLARRPRGRALAATLALAGIAFSGALVWKLGSVRAAPDSYARAAAWIEENAGSIDRIGTANHFDLPLFFDERAARHNRPLRRVLPWVRYQVDLDPAQRAGAEYPIFLPREPSAELREALLSDPLAWFRRGRSTRALLEVDSGDETGDRVFRVTRDAFRAYGAPLWSFSPRRSARPARLDHQHLKRLDLGDPAWLEIWDSCAIGPALEIYAVPQDDPGSR